MPCIPAQSGALICRRGSGLPTRASLSEPTEPAHPVRLTRRKVLERSSRQAPLTLVAVFLGSGVYVGIEEVLERAAAADLLRDGQRACGFGALATVTGLGDPASGVLVGFLR